MVESEDVRRILRTTDLYEVLGVERNCTTEDLKKRYRKLATQIHPDRCKDPKATEAFQKVSHSYQTLSDEQKRSHYDRFGDDKPQVRTQQYQRGEYYHDEIDPEDLFRAFFGGGIGPNVHFQFNNFGEGMYVRGGRRMRGEQEPMFNGRMLLILVPLVLILIANFVSSSFNDPFKKEVEKEIKFPPMSKPSKTDGTYSVFKSAKYGRQFKVSKQWLSTQQRYNGPLDARFYRKLKECADDIYENKIRNKCRNEMMTSQSRPACVEMREHSIHL